MAKKRRKSDENGVWVSERYSLKGPNAERAYEKRPGGPPTSNRFLELADIALGDKKPEKKKATTAANPTHVTTKKEPYSR